MEETLDSKAFEAIKELVVTEYKYFTSLKVLMNAFGLPLSPSTPSPFHVLADNGDEHGNHSNAVSFSHQDWHLVFSKIPKFITLHESILKDFLNGLSIPFEPNEPFDFNLISKPTNLISLGELGNIFLKHVTMVVFYYF